MSKVADLTITSDAPGARLFLLGNEAIARGAIEAGVQVVAAYPGTPSSEITTALVGAAKDLGIYAEWSVNEKVAFEVAFAASMSGLKSLSIMKHVGVNVAHDPIMSASYMGVGGGFVLISADDPGQWSSQNEQDNRYLARQAYIPVLEPYSAQEAKDMMAQAFRLSEEFNQLIMLRSVTRIGHGRSDVVFGEINKEKRKGKFSREPRWICLPATARGNRKLVVDRLAKIQKAFNNISFNQLDLKEGAKLGIITCGISHGYALEAIKWLGIEDKVSVLKVGTPYPLPDELTRQLLGSVSQVLVVEETEPFVEDEVKVIAEDAGILADIHGKDMLPIVGELSTRLVAEALSELSEAQPPIDFAQLDKIRDETASLLPFRPPTMCAGCPHRGSFYAINIASNRVERETGLKPVLTGDIGCYALGANPPLSGEHTAVCMGAGFGIATGLAKVQDAPVIAHLGDSTFFHSGMAPMINAVFNNANLTMVVFDNSTTGMTGFQPNPGAPTSEGTRVAIEDIARAAGVKFVELVDAFDISGFVETLERAIKHDGPSFIVARRLCNIIDQREKRRQGVKTVPYQVDREKCVGDSPPYCQATCPLHIDVKGYVGLVRQGKFDDALALIKQKLPFPSIVGRICTRPCEGKCKRAEVDEAIAIDALKRSAADLGNAPDDYSIAEEKGKKVAVVGGGPAGLMAAYDLRKNGYGVTLYEALPVLGGMMAIGIPEFRLPRDILKKETGILEKLGVEVKLNTRIGTDVKLSDLKNDYDSVFVAVGAHQGRSLGVENSETNGVVDGIDFLARVNNGEKVDIADKVVIVGGGNVAIDCARACIRLGFKDVNIVYRRSREEMPAIVDEVAEAEEEGLKIQFLANPVRVLSEANKVNGVECVKMELGAPDESGRKRPVPIAVSEFTIATGLVITAIGEQPDLEFMTGDAASAVSDGLIKADPVTLETGVKGLFAGGDTVTGPASVIDALATGRKAAISIDRYLKGESLDVGREGEGPQVSRLIVDTFGVAQASRLKMPTLEVDKRQGAFTEVDLGFTKEEAVKEAERCLSCECNICINLLGCPAIIKENGHVTIDTSQCPGCGVCAQVCPNEAIKQE